MNRLRLSDLLRLSTNSLSQHKGRAVMTLLGVVLGAFLLVVSLSVGQGMKHAVKRSLSFGGRLKVIRVYPDRSADPDNIPAEELEVKGELSEERRERLRQRLIAQWQMEHHYRPVTPLTEDRLNDIESWEQVDRVTPAISDGTRVRIGNREKYAQLTARWSDNPFVSKMVVSGRPDPDDAGRGILIHEFLAYRLGYRTEEELTSLIGKPVRLEISSHLSRGIIDLLTMDQLWRNEEAFNPAEEKQLEGALEELSTGVDSLPLTDEQKQNLKKLLRPKVPQDEHHYHIVEQYTIAGLFRSPTDEELESEWEEHQLSYAELILPMRTARSLISRIPDEREAGYQNVRVIADDELHVKEVSEKLRKAGFQPHSQIEFIEMIQTHVAIITSVMATLAMTALIVAALGTSNVMAMSVLERTHEIGIMKAVGAREGTIRAIFLMEGSLVGLIGGVIGVVLGRLAYLPGNAITRWIMSMTQSGFENELEGTLFAYPLWVMLGVPALAAFITMLAAYIPARRASRIDPIEALRHD